MLLLKTTLLLNGVSSFATGVGLIVFASKVAELFGVADTAAIIEAGIFLIVFASLVLFTATKNPQNNDLVRLIILLDLLWVVGSIILIVIARSSLSTIGIVAILAVAVWVGLMALLQTKGIKKPRVDATVISMILFFTLLSSTGCFAQSMKTTPGVSKPEEVVTSFLNAVKEKSHAKAAPLLDSLVEWSQPGSNRFSGVKKSRQQVFAMFKGFIEMSVTTLTLTDVKVIAINENKVIRYAIQCHFERLKGINALMNKSNRLKTQPIG